jgi:hypothetical protein
MTVLDEEVVSETLFIKVIFHTERTGVGQVRVQINNRSHSVLRPLCNHFVPLRILISI